MAGRFTSTGDQGSTNERDNGVSLPRLKKAGHTPGLLVTPGLVKAYRFAAASCAERDSIESSESNIACAT